MESSSLLFAPHGDDECLFAAYTLLRERPYVVVVLDCGGDRDDETDRALEVLGVDSWERWPYPEDAPDWAAVENAMRLADERLQPARVFAPAVELGGHDHHNHVGHLAERVFGDRVTSYLTYERGMGRSRSAVESRYEPGWPDLKAAALQCYRSQIADPATAPWFADGEIREWYAA